MAKTVFLTIKRLAGNKALLLALTLSPLLLVAVFGAVIAPVYFTGSMQKATVAILNQDTDPLTDSIIKGLVSDEQTRGLISVVYVASGEEGRQLLDSGAAALISIPPGFQRTLRGGGHSSLGLQLNSSKRMESTLIRDVLASGVQMVNDAQRAVNALYSALAAGGVPADKASEAAYASAKYFMVQALNRKAVIDIRGELSPLGSLLPVEYYAAALLAVFLFFSAMGIAGLTAQDCDNGLLDRHISYGGKYGWYAGVRMLSGAVLVLMQGIPAAGLILLVSSPGFYYSGSPALAIPAIILIAGIVSSMAVWAGLLCRSRDAAVKAVFLVVCILAGVGGAVIPASGLGPLSGIAPYTPVHAAMRVLSSAFFFFDRAVFMQSSAILLAYTLLFTAGACVTARRRA